MELQDQHARDIVANALDKNLMVLAGAGAGKTYALVQRMVNAVCSGVAQADQMAAITFTRKAAGEMRGRFFLQLRERAEKATGDEATRIRHALAHIDQCFVGTIHSFCGQLLHERPMAIGLPPEFSEVEDREEAIMRRDAWDGFVQKCFLNEDPRLTQFEYLGLRTEDLYAYFQRRCQFSDVQLKPTAVEVPILQKAVDEAIVFLEQTEAFVPDPIPGKRDGLQSTLLRARLFLKNHGIYSDADRMTLLQFFTGSPSVTLKNWAPNQNIAKQLRDETLPQLQETVLTPILTQWRQYVYQHVAAFIDDAVHMYAESRRTTGRLTFQDLLELSARLLRHHPDVRKHFQNRYRCLFVDEFQDTDPIQAEVLLYLTGTDCDETDWQKLMPRPGSLFLVGDEKQSIYRFRRADVETFRMVRDRVSESGGEVVHLNTSFRSLGQLCDWVNSAFEPLFAAQEKQYQADFGPLFKYRQEGENAIRSIRIGKVSGNKRADIVAQDAERIADFIAAAIKGETEFHGSDKDATLPPQASPGDFLILTRTTNYLSTYAQALENRGIPFDMTGGSRLGKAEEVIAVADLLETIYTPDNPLPLLAYLRGALVGMGDDLLYAFKKAGGTFNYTKPLPNGLDTQTQKAFETACQHIQQMETWLHTLPPSTALERCLNTLGLMPFARVQPMGATRVGNLLRLLSLIQQWESQGMHWGHVFEELQLLINDNDYKVEQITLASGQENVVRLMNLHQSKGLQGRVVFLADPYDTSSDRYGPDFHVSRMSGDPFLSMPVSKHKGPFAREIIAEPEGWAHDEAEEAHFLTAEDLRLLYVAATRAENLLIVSTYEGNADRGPWASLYPFLEGVPELTIYPFTSIVPEDLGVLDLAQQRKERADFWQATRQASHHIHNVTDDQPDFFVARSAPSRGAAYGTVIHQLFNTAIHHRLPDDPTAYIRFLFAQHNADTLYLDDAQKTLTDFYTSDLWTEIQSSPTVYTEVPFAMSKSNTMSRGVIDLIYRLSDGWKIVDYKTNAVQTDEEVQALSQQTTPQLTAYADHWAHFTGEQVTVKGLWLTEQCVFKAV